MKNCPLRKRGSEKRYAFWIFLCRTGLPCHAVLPILDGHSGSDRPFTTIEENASEIISFIDEQLGGSALLIGGLSLGAQVLLEMLSQRRNLCSHALVESASVVPSKLTNVLIAPAFGSSYGLIKNRRFANLQFRSLHMRSDLFEDYYRDIHRWSFNLEVYFLKERFRDLLTIAEADHTIIQDRTIYEGVYVFMQNNKAMGNLSERDYQTYMELFEQMMSMVRVPDLMIYLRASVPHLVGNIQKRGRDYEQTIQLEYLQNLNERYEDFIYHKYPGQVMTIEKDNLDFLNQSKDFAQIVDRIDRTLFGLFEL